MESDSLELPSKVGNYIPDMRDWVECGRTFPVSAVTTAAESYRAQGGEHAPSYMTVADEESVTPMLMGQMSGHILSCAGVEIRGDDTSHEDFAFIKELYLLSRNVFSRYVVELLMSGNMMNGNSLGHNVFEIGEIEVASPFSATRIEATRILAVASIQFHRLRVELPILCVRRSHFDGSTWLFVVGSVVEKRIGIADGKRKG